MSKEWATTDELISGVKKRISRNKRRLMLGTSEKEKLIVSRMLESDRALLQELKDLKRSTGR